MKSKFELSVIIIVGLLVTSILYFIFSDEEQISTFKYESIEYDDLVSRSAKLGLYAVPENYEKQICFLISKNDPINLLDVLSEHIDDTSDIRADVKFSNIPPEFHTRFDTQIKTSLALEMIEMYDFDATMIKTDNNVGKIPDRLYHFDCPFEYENEQMMLRIMFESHFWENMPAYVNVTRNDLEISMLVNENITVLVGGINSTVLFQNDLNKEITIRSTDPINYQRNENDKYYDSKEPERLFENKFAKITNEDKITIPPGKVFSYHFSSWDNPHNIPLNYTIIPLNLKGTITVIPYYDCAPSQDIFSAYSKIHKIPEVPTYLPDGYKYECGFYHYPEAATYYYANSTVSKKFRGELGHGINHEFLAAGGLAIRLSDVKSYGTPYIETDSDKFTRLTERFSSESMITYLNGQPTVLQKTNYGDLFNRITIYLDYNTWYVIEGGIQFSELHRIAESIPFEKGDGSSSITGNYENPFKDKSLVIELIDMKEIYQPGKPIHFEIFTQGHIPVSSQLAVTIQESGGEDVIWQNISTINIGDPEIGFVDYTWTTEYDLGIPKIRDTGDYIMTVSWNDVAVQHKFQIREEVQFSLLQDMIPEHAHKEDFLSVFSNECSRKEMKQIPITENTETDIQEIRDELEKSNQLLNLIFEKQEVMTNDKERTRSYDVPDEVIHCIENVKNDKVHLVENLKQYGEKPEYNVQLLLRESEIFYHGHQHHQAIKTADFILENIENENVHALVVKGNSLARLGQSEKAIEAYGKAIKINPDFAEGWFSMGRVLSSNDQHDMAIQHFDQAIK